MSVTFFVRLTNTAVYMSSFLDSIKSCFDMWPVSGTTININSA